jgi:N-acetylmuramoyl-L-alanine amidase
VNGSGASVERGTQQPGDASRGTQAEVYGGGMSGQCDRTGADVTTAGSTVLAASIAGGEKKPVNRISPAERLRRTNVILEHFGVQPARNVDALLANLAGLQTKKDLESRLALLDSAGELRRYIKFAGSAAQPVLQVFKDPGTKKILDREIPLRVGSSAQAGDTPAAFHARLLAASNNPKGRELEGLRIAIDPGHMGGNLWGKRTGKYIAHSGRVLHEGDLTLAVAEALAAKLRARGAEVVLTRTGKAPVTEEGWNDIDIAHWGREELRASVTQPWFQKIVSQAKNDSDLIDRAKRSPWIRNLFVEQYMKGRYFFLRSDLRARADKMAEHRPDITLVLHFDALPTRGSPHGVNPKAPSVTRSYVPGTFLQGELASPEARARALRHLLEPEGFDASVDLSDAIVSRLATDHGMQTGRRHGPGAEAVTDGVFSRNLTLTRQVHDSALAYLELAFYNHPRVFEALFRGQRLDSIAKSVEGGVVGFVTEYGKND